MVPKDEISSVEIEARLSQFEKQLDRLYRRFEQYFVGVEKRPPHQGRRDIMRLYRELEKAPMIRTDLKFRFRALTQRLTTYKTYWTRIERQIEDGTYHRDLARAKARQKRRVDREEKAMDERAENPGSGQAEDGAFELDEWDLEDLDLSSLEKEFDEMEQRGEFEKYVGTQKVRQPNPSANSAAGPAATSAPKPSQSYQDPGAMPAVDTSVKKKRLAELQAKLGISTRSVPDTSEPSDKRDSFSRRDEGATQRARPENPSAPSRGADVSRLRELRRAKERLSKERQSKGRSANKQREQPPQKPQPNRRERVIKRTGAAARAVEARKASSGSGSSGSASGFSDEKSRKIYNTLLQAKQRCKEDTSRLNYDAFKHTIERQRTQIQRKKGARDVDFKVVIKEGRAFLKPETKD